MIIGTAGHIDHGKTTLVKALTGVDADRLPEEKARGITLDLGYAYVPTEDGGMLGFVDVPGHEKLIHNMLAGATGIDYLLLVIAADDGPMPQTREHLELAELLGIGRGAVALTKVDVVAAERVVAAEQEVRALLAGSPFEEAPLFRVSGHSGAGIAALQSHLAEVARSWQPRVDAGGFRLAVDRCFSLAGAGTIVTGTIHAGRVRVGDTVTLSPPGLAARVRSLRAQDRETAEGRAGERCALALAGIERKDVARGMWVVATNLHQPLQRFQAEIRLPRNAKPLVHWAPVHVHLGADDIMGRVALLEGERVEAGQSMLAEIMLERESHSVRGDRFVLRDASAMRTVAGGRVLDIFPPARHKRSAERLDTLHALADDDPATALNLAAVRQIAGVDLARYAANWNLDSGAATQLWQSARLTVVDGVGFSAGNWQALADRLLAALAAEHERAPDLQGVEHERLRRLTLPALSRGAFNALLDLLLGAGKMARSGAWLHLPGHRVELSAADSELWNSLRPLLDATPYGPPRVRDIARAGGTLEDTVRRLFKHVARVGLAYPVAHDHYFTAPAVAELARIVAELNQSDGVVRAAALRDRIGGGRKVSIHILEFFDRIGYTRRVRDEHVLRQSGAPLVWTQRAITEESVPRWGGRSSKPAGAAMRSLVGSTPTLFRQVDFLANMRGAIQMNAAIETDRLAWRPALEVGVKEIDSQHQELFALFNSTLEAARADEPGQMAIHLETLGNRTAAHFAFEQEQFAGLDPALREEHIEEHRKLLDEFGEQVDDWRDKKISTREIVRFVSIWLVRHIAALDISTFKQIAKGTSSPRE